MGGNLFINQGVQATALGAGVLLKASGNITLDASRSVVTNGGDITFWADSDASGTGGIQLKNGTTLDARRTVDRTASLTSTATGGGAITLGGGLDDGGSASATSALVNGLALAKKPYASGLDHVL